MKPNIKKSFWALFILTMTLTSCDELLDLDPPMTQVTENFYRDEKDAFQALTAAYNILTWSSPSTAAGSPQNAAFEIISEILGDCCYAGGANANDIPTTVRLSQFTARVTDPAPEALWRKYFSGIYRCNQFLVKIDDIPFKDEDLKKQYKAEAHFLRANYYFDVVRLFGNVPIILQPLTPADYAQVQANPEDVYKLIAEDLLAAINSKKEDGTSALPRSAIDIPADSKGRVSLAAAKSLLARVWLYYTGYYEKAELPLVTSTEMINMINDVAGNSGHSLLINAYERDNSGVTPLFNVANKNSAEGVFEIQYSALSKWGDWGSREGCMGNQAIVLWGIRDAGSPYAAGWSFAPVNKKLFEAFDPADPRRYATIINANPSIVTGDDGENLSYTKGYQNTGYFCRKFTPLTANNSSAGSRELNYPNNYISIRFADVLLMASELEFRYGSKAKAFEYYKQVRERAMGTGSAGTEAALTLEKIFDERLYELALEGQRYWDILRQGQTKAAQLLSNGEAGDFAVTYDASRKGLLPIPQYEIIQSKRSLQQNPGYN